jgi:hypothetical protein
VFGVGVLLCLLFENCIVDASILEGWSVEFWRIRLVFLYQKILLFSGFCDFVVRVYFEIILFWFYDFLSVFVLS